MESQHTSGVHLTIGTPVTTIFHVDGRPSASQCTVQSEAPLFLTTADKGVPALEFPRPVMLIWHCEDHLYKGEGDVVAVESRPQGSLLEIKQVKWEDLNRRRHPRIPVSVPVALRAVHEVQGETVIQLFQGVTEDISLGGAWVRVQPQIEPGSLVEFQANLGPNETVRTLGVIAHSSETRAGVGIEFLDYIGSARYTLHCFLARAA